jgi:hypothetical protein
MKISKTLLALFLISTLQSSTVLAAGLGDILTMQNWRNSGYQAICADGTSETLDNVDIKLNNACPKGDTNATNNILVMHQLVSGEFDVTCVDLTRITATAAEIVESQVCMNNGLLKSSSDALNGQLRTDGNFDLVCGDGSREVVSPQDIRLDNLCPRLNINHGPRTIMTMYKNAEDTFDLHCTDGTTKSATVDELRANDLCEPVFVGPQAGEYKVESGYSSYCAQRLIPTVTGGSVTSISISFIGACSGTTFQYSCSADTCTASNGNYTAVLQDETHYKFTRTSDGKSAVFVFVRDVQDLTKVALNLEETIGQK